MFQEKSLDVKLRRIHADPLRAKDFILADAKDADMALSIGAPGRSPEAHSGELRFERPQMDDQVLLKSDEGVLSLQEWFTPGASSSRPASVSR